MGNQIDLKLFATLKKNNERDREANTDKKNKNTDRKSEPNI